MAGKITISQNLVFGSSHNNLVSLPYNHESEVDARNNTVVGANLVRVRSWEEDMAKLCKEFPHLMQAPSDAFMEVAHRMKGVSEPEGMSIFRHSRLGHWLQSQKATDWVNIGLAMWRIGRGE